MKEGFYIRYVPSKNEHIIYFYIGNCLFFLSELTSMCFHNGETVEINVNDDTLFWQLSQHKVPSKRLGFNFMMDF